MCAALRVRRSARDDAEVAQVLIEAGADRPNLRDPEHHRTPLEECLDSPGHDEVEAILRPLTGNYTPGKELM